MKNIRSSLNWDKNYSEVNREERNLAAILYHVLLLKDNLQKFLALIDCPFQIINTEMGIYFEYAYIRDLWFNIADNETKQRLICELLNLKNPEGISEKSILQFNTYFGAVRTPSWKYIQSPGQWSLQRYDTTIKDNDDFLSVCKFKWAFNAKPDIVIHTSKDQAICIEAKLESPESYYPQDSKEKKIFAARKLERVSQTELQKYLMEKLLGIETKFVLIQKSKIFSPTHQSLLWGNIFKELNIAEIPNFMQATVDSIERLPSIRTDIGKMP